jgi:hypothetical protein
MHTKVTLNRDLGRLLGYHERKVKKELAECLYAGNMLKEAPELSQKEKQFFLQRLHGLNDRVRRKTLHLFLSWHRSDTLDNDKMRKVSRDYLQEMGLGKQPYLIYRHLDTPQPHAHIVTTNIRPDATRITIWRAERLKSMQISRQLEIKYGLYRAGKRLPDDEWVRQHPVQKVVYGVTSLRPTMNAVLQKILASYNHTSVEELNAVLRAYNIQAIRGAERSNTRKHSGLLFLPLTDSGEKTGVYLRASSLHSKPTLRNLQKLFTNNMTARPQFQQRLTSTIDWIFFKQQVTQSAFRQALLKEKIRVVEGTDTKRGFFYIDELTKTVYEGERLGRKYSADGIGERCISEELWRRERSLKQEQKQHLRQRPKIDLY